MTSARIVLHGKQAANPEVREAVEKERAAGHRVEVRVTWEPGDAARLAGEAARLGIGRVVAGGGDGTLNEVVSGLLAEREEGRTAPDLAVLPLGTANDFAHACGIPLDPSAALQLALTAEPRPVDLGRVGGRFFVNMATGGFGTEITVGTRPELKKALHGAAYLVTALSHLTEMAPVEARFSGPGFSWSGRLLVLAVGNGRQAGGGHTLCPGALVDDGLLDVTLLPDLPRGERTPALLAVFREGRVALWRQAVTARLPWLELESPQPLQINLDGEPTSGSTLRFEVMPAAIRLCLPDDSPVRGQAAPGSAYART